MPSGNVGSVSDKLTPMDVVEFVAEALNISAATLDVDSCASDIPEWDSIGFMSLLMALDQAGVPCDLGDTGAVQSMPGILGLFRAAGRLE